MRNHSSGLIEVGVGRQQCLAVKRSQPHEHRRRRPAPSPRIRKPKTWTFTSLPRLALGRLNADGGFLLKESKVRMENYSTTTNPGEPEFSQTGSPANVNASLDSMESDAPLPADPLAAADTEETLPGPGTGAVPGMSSSPASVAVSTNPADNSLTAVSRPRGKNQRHNRNRTRQRDLQDCLSEAPV